MRSSSNGLIQTTCSLESLRKYAKVLTHCGQSWKNGDLKTVYIGLGVARQHQTNETITGTNVDLSLMRLYGIHLRYDFIWNTPR